MSMTVASCLNSQKDHGQIQIVFGPMFSGKTTELMRRMKRYQIANHSCLIIKYAKDTRYDENGIATHDRQTLPAVGAEVLSELTSQALQYDVIGIDEGQFFPDIATFSDKMAQQGKIVIVAALDGTYQKKGFGNILDLVPLAESVVKLSAVCMTCFKEASFTKKMVSRDKVVIEIGGADKYMSVCRQCFFSPVKNHDNKPTTNSRSPLRALNNDLSSSSVQSSQTKGHKTPVKSVSSPMKMSQNALVDVENAVKRLF